MILEKEFLYKGLKCEVKINENMGFRCGYVTLPENHPFISKNYNYLDVDCHGGLTYKEYRVIGFDCGHCGDGIDLNLISNSDIREAQIKIKSTIPNMEDEVKSLEFVENECIKIVDQALNHKADI